MISSPKNIDFCPEIVYNKLIVLKEGVCREKAKCLKFN